jgi:hypothetical protein
MRRPGDRVAEMNDYADTVIRSVDSRASVISVSRSPLHVDLDLLATGSMPVAAQVLSD